MRLRPRRLFWRIYLHGLVGLVVFALGMGALLYALRDDRGPLHGLPGHVVRVMPELATADGPALTDPLTALSEMMRMNVAVYRADGSPIAAAGPDVPGPLQAGDPRLDGRAVGFGRGFRHYVAVPVPGSDRYVMVTWQRSFVSRLSMGIVAVLIFIGMLSIPAAWAVARPLNRLTATAQALGGGDLDARTGLDRGDEIGDLARAMDEMAGRLQRILARERELLADISHELRTPLARIRVALELQAEEEGGLGEFLDGVEDDLAELEGLVADVLTSARLDLTEGEAGFAMRPVELDLGETVGASVERFRRRHGSRAIEVTMADDLPRPRADQALVRRVIDNLLENAARYSDAGIELRAEAAAGAVAVTVADRGVGISEEDLPRVFEPFFRGDRSRTRATGGVGLGLTLCRRIVEAHGGLIEARPRPGGGALFRFTLPLEGGPVLAVSDAEGCSRGWC